jgi:phenylalanyl-tRNA synthetase beta subunit
MRLDLQIEEDMAEEIGRVIGYDRIKPILPARNASHNEAGGPKREPETKVNETFYKMLWARNKLLEDGYSEVMTYAFCDKGEVEVLASASDKKFLRTNLADGLKESVKLNQLNLPLVDMDEVKIFEIGTVFNKHNEVINVCYGDKKNIIEKSLDEFCRDIPITELDALLQKTKTENQEANIFKMWSLYPFIIRDIAVWVPEGTKPEKLLQVYREFGTELLIKEPRLFDSFTKDKKTSFAYRLVFQAGDRTLTDEEVGGIMSKITEKIVSLGWQVR